MANTSPHQRNASRSRSRARTRAADAPEADGGRGGGDPPRRAGRLASADAITTAATTLFLRNGYDRTSMDDIAALARVSKQTVYTHFADKEALFTAIVLATTDQVDELVQLIAGTFGETRDLEGGLRELARRFLMELMRPDLLRLRRLVIATADRFPHVGRAWYERGFERVLGTLAESFRRLSDDGLLHVDDPSLAAQHFVGMLLWIPVNRAMFTGNEHHDTKADLEHYADAAVDTFLTAYAPA